MHVDALVIRVADYRRLELHGVLAPIGLRNGQQLVLFAALKGNDGRPSWAIPTSQSPIVFGFGIPATALASDPVVPQTQADFATAGLGTLRRFAEWTQAVDVLKIGELEALAVERGEFLLGTVIALDALLDLAHLILQIVHGTLSFLKLLARLSGLVYDGLGLLVVLNGGWFLGLRLFFGGDVLDFTRMTFLFEIYFVLLFLVTLLSFFRWALLFVFLFLLLIFGFMLFSWFKDT